jgi:hypothetical protein
VLKPTASGRYPDPSWLEINLTLSCLFVPLRGGQLWTPTGIIINSLVEYKITNILRFLKIEKNDFSPGDNQIEIQYLVSIC